MNKGNIITLAGFPSTGKTTLGRALADKDNIPFLEQNWREISFFAEGKTPTNFEICIGFLNLRFAQISQAEKFANDGKNVLLDTFFEMTNVYLEQILTSDEYIEFKKVFDIYRKNLPEPDLYVRLTGNLSVIRERALARKLGMKNEDQLVSLENLQKNRKPNSGDSVFEKSTSDY